MWCAFVDLVAQVAAHHPASNTLCDRCLDSLIEAAGLYRADFLSGFTLSDALEFDEWQTYQTETLRLELAERPGEAGAWPGSSAGDSPMPSLMPDAGWHSIR